MYQRNVKWMTNRMMRQVTFNLQDLKKLLMAFTQTDMGDERQI